MWHIERPQHHIYHSSICTAVYRSADLLMTACVLPPLCSMLPECLLKGGRHTAIAYAACSDSRVYVTVLLHITIAYLLICDDVAPCTA